MNYGFLYEVEETLQRRWGPIYDWKGYNRTIVGGDDIMGSNGHTCLYDTNNSELLFAAHESHHIWTISAVQPNGDLLEQVHSSYRWLAPQWTRDEAPPGHPFFGNASTYVTSGNWQSYIGPYVLHPYDGCCEASIPDAVARTWFRLTVKMVIIKEVKIQTYINGIPQEDPFNKYDRDWAEVFYSFEGIYRGDDACDGATSLVCDGSGGGGDPEIGDGGGEGWSMIAGIPIYEEMDMCPSSFYRIPNDVQYRYSLPDFEESYTGKSRFKITNMSFS